MAREWDQANAWQRGIRRFAASDPGSWLFSRTLDHLDRVAFRLTKGRHMVSSLLSALPGVGLIPLARHQRNLARM